MESLDFNVFVGAETGLLKGVQANPKANIVKNFHALKKLDREQEITAMAWGEQGQGEILTGLRNGTVKVFSPAQKEFTASVDCASGEDKEGLALRGVARVDGALVTAAHSGDVRVWRSRAEDRVAFNTVEQEVNRMGKLRGVGGEEAFADEDERAKHVATLRAGRHLCRMRQAGQSSGIIATGGKENDLQVWDLNKPDSPIFRAKNVPPDYLQLRVPVWVSDLCFPDASSTSLVSTINRHGHIRLYDIRAAGGQRRPVQEVSFEGETLTAMSPSPLKDQVIVGTATGQMALFDFRQEKKGMFRKYKGCVGSVRSIECCRETGYFAAAGLDRFLRVYHVSSKKLVQKEYLKSRLNCLLLCDDFNPTKAESERQEEAEKKGAKRKEEEEEDNFWETLDTVGATKSKISKESVSSKKRKIK